MGDVGNFVDIFHIFPNKRPNFILLRVLMLTQKCVVSFLGSLRHRCNSLLSTLDLEELRGWQEAKQGCSGGTQEQGEVPDA